MLLAVLCAGLFLNAGPTPRAASYAATPAPDISFQPATLAFSGPEIVNPLRGLYRWRGQENAPQPRSAYDSYERYSWRQLEPAPGQYDFSQIEQDLAAAAAAGRKHGFRIRALATGSGILVPDFLMGEMELGWWHDSDRNGTNDTYVPDWNDPDFLARARALTAALGERFDGDPRVNWIDIGMYGAYGEWNMAGFSYPSPTGARAMRWENRRQIVDDYVAAFPATQLVMLSDDVEALPYALRLSPTIGWRRDSLGSTTFTDSVSFRYYRAEPEIWDLLTQRFRSAPVIAEFINPSSQVDPTDFQRAIIQARMFGISLVGNGNAISYSRLSSAGRSAYLELGKTVGYRFELKRLTLPGALSPGDSFSVESEWQNVGIAPAYEPWSVVFQLRDAHSGTPVWEGNSGLSLRAFQPSGGSPTVQRDSFSLPADLPPGSYHLAVIVRDPRGQRAPLALAISGGGSDGAYLLGSLAVMAPNDDPPAPTPTLSALNPTSVAVQSGSFTLSVSGSGFTAGSVVRWNGFDRPTSFVDAQTLQATIADDDIAALGTASVTVFTPPAGGGLSNALPLNIVANPAFTPTPTVTRTPTRTTGPTSTPTRTNIPGPTNTPGPSSTPSRTPAVTNTPTHTPISTGPSLSFVAVADTFVDQYRPNNSFGSSSQLQAMGFPNVVQQLFLRFDVSGIPTNASVSSALLRLTVTNDSNFGGIIYRLSNNSWPETVTWASRPAVEGTPLTMIDSAVAVGEVLEFDLTSAINGNGSFSFALLHEYMNSNIVGYASREHTTSASRPQLLIATQLAAPTPTSTSTTLPTDTATSTTLPTDTATSTALPTDTATSTALPTDTATSTALPTDTATSTALPTDTATSTALPTSTRTSTALPTSTRTSTALPTSTRTSTALPTSTRTSTPISAQSFSFGAVADTFVRQASASSSYGTQSQVEIAGTTNDNRRAFLRFNVSGLPSGAAITSAKLRLHVTNSSNMGGTLYRVSSNTWSESITWKTQPAISGAALWNGGSVALNQVVEIPLSGVVTGNGSYSFAIYMASGNSDLLAYASRQNTTSTKRPLLIVSTGSGPTPTRTRTPTPTRTRTPTPRG
jgi:hypothetical protein